MLDLFKQFIAEHQLLNDRHHYLLACSGGVDSMVLLDLCKRAGIPFDLAHVNYGLRGNDSDQDEALVLETSIRLNLKLHRIKFPDSDQVGASGFNLQEKARNFRYQWFDQLKDENGNPFAGVITAHHGSDQVETVLKNLFFGTGVNGMTGMRPVQKILHGLSRIRPLLFANKTMLVQYAVDRQLKWREDKSNQEEYYIRNFIRNSLINNLLGRIPKIENNILDTVDRIGEIDEFFRGQAELWMQKHGIIKKGESRLPILALKKTKGYLSLIEYWLKPAGFSHAQSKAVMELVNAANGKYIASETHRVVRDRGWLVLMEKKAEQADIYILDNDCKILNYNGEKLEIVVKKQSELEKSPMVAQLNYSTLEFPLILRRWKEGDYFYPLGMSKKKKLSRFLIDIKLTPLEKESVWVLESNKRICWVVGYRIDNRFKVDLNTDNVFKINKI